MPSLFFCENCNKETRFLPIQKALQVAGVCRSTIYYWIDHGWVHWRRLPSSRRVICVESLSQTEHPKKPAHSPTIFPKVSDAVQFRKLKIS